MPRAWASSIPQTQRLVGLGGLCLALAGLVASFVLFLTFAWPTKPDVSTSSRIHVGKADMFLVGEPIFFLEEGKFWLVKQEDGSFLALYLHDPDRGCSVPWRPTFAFPDPETGQDTKGWFRNPCSGSTFDVAGRCVFGSCVRGLDRYETDVRGNQVWVETGRLIKGPTR